MVIDEASNEKGHHFLDPDETLQGPDHHLFAEFEFQVSDEVSIDSLHRLLWFITMSSCSSVFTVYDPGWNPISLLGIMRTH